MYLRTEPSPFHAAPPFPVLRASKPSKADLYWEKESWEGAFLNAPYPMAAGYIAWGTLEAGSAPTQRLLASYCDAQGWDVHVHVTQDGYAWWVSSGEEDWQEDSGDGFPKDFPQELRDLL